MTPHGKHLRKHVECQEFYDALPKRRRRSSSGGSRQAEAVKERAGQKIGTIAFTGPGFPVSFGTWASLG